MSSIDSHIHVEVLKLYPEASLPRFETIMEGDLMSMIYTSQRKMASFAQGLIEGSIEYFREDYKVSREDIKDDGSKVKFTLTREL